VSLKLLYIGLNPIQNAKPYRLLNDMPGVEYTVAYLKRPDSGFSGKENITKAAFSHDLTAGYNHVFPVNNSPLKNRGGFLGYFHPGIFGLVSRHDIIVIYGHNTLTFVMALLWGRLLGKKVVLTNDATYIEANDESSGMMLRLKPFFLRMLYNRLSHGVFTPSTASALFIGSMGVKKENIAVTPYVVDEDLITDVSRKTDVKQARLRFGIADDDFVFVFCAKFISRKRPQDAIEALALVPGAKLVMIGAGPEEEMLRNMVAEKQLEGRVIFPGLVKYTELPSFYTMCDALVFCSDHEPYGLPVNEAMLCGIPVVVSDRIGARLDLVEEEVTGFIYSCGNVRELAAAMLKLSGDPALAKNMGAAARLKMDSWSSTTNVSRQMDYFRKKGWPGK
jgi:glycosyltransferase involved in cell wall biosynthesis